MISLEDIVRERIKRLREDRDLKQKDLARILGLKTQTVSAMEAGRRSIPLRYLDVLCKEFSLPPEYFFCKAVNSNLANKLGMELLSSLEDVANLPDDDRMVIKSHIDFLASRNKK